MASTKKTEKLGLNSWESSDRPQRNDFNSDNLIIDTVLGTHVESSDLHLTSTEKARVSRPLVPVAYAGDGKSTYTVELSFNPTAVIVYCVGKPFAMYDSAQGVNKVYGAMAVYGAAQTAGVELAGNKVVVHQSEASSGVKHCLNEADAQYKIIAIR